jgi:hypothetical protein
MVGKRATHTAMVSSLRCPGSHYQDGSVAYGCPQDTDSYRATARELGYGDDTWALTREHEILHTALAELRGERHSRSLWAQAHKPEGVEFDATKMPEAAQAEEDRLFQLQRLLNKMRSGPVAQVE